MPFSIASVDVGIFVNWISFFLLDVGNIFVFTNTVLVVMLMGGYFRGEFFFSVPAVLDYHGISSYRILLSSRLPVCAIICTKFCLIIFLCLMFCFQVAVVVADDFTSVTFVTSVTYFLFFICLSSFLLANFVDSVVFNEFYAFSVLFVGRLDNFIDVFLFCVLCDFGRAAVAVVDYFLYVASFTVFFPLSLVLYDFIDFVVFPASTEINIMYTGGCF